MQNPLFCVNEETRTVYDSKKVGHNPRVLIYARSQVLASEQKHGRHTVIRNFVEFGEKIIEETEWCVDVLHGRWKAKSSTGDVLSGNFVDGRAEGRFELYGSQRMTLMFHRGLLDWWKFSENTKLFFSWDDKNLTINPREEKFCVKTSKKKRNGQVGHLLFYCLSLYGESLLNSKGEAFTLHFRDRVYRVPYFQKELELEKMLWAPRWHETVYSAVKNMWTDYFSKEKKKYPLRKV